MSDDTLTGTRHCDDYIQSPSALDCLRWFLLINRMPAVDRCLADDMGINPELYADLIKPNDGTGRSSRVRIVMASRFGDVGISNQLGREHCYYKRVGLDELTNFSDKP